MSKELNDLLKDMLAEWIDEGKNIILIMAYTILVLAVVGIIYTLFF